MHLKFWGSFCSFMEPVSVSVIRDMAVCCICRHGILWELTILLLVDADCLGSRGTVRWWVVTIHVAWPQHYWMGIFWCFLKVISHWRMLVAGIMNDFVWISYLVWSSWYMWDHFGIHEVIHMLFSPATWCCLSLNGAVLPLSWHILCMFLHLGLKQQPICPMQTMTHSQGITFYPQTKIICQWCRWVLILSSLNVQFLVWTSLEAPWWWLRWSVCQISYLPVNKTT